jgi:hypothetical protein
MATTTFGDMLDAAERHFAAAEATRSHATGSADTVRALHRLVTSMARALDSVVGRDMIESAVQPEPDIWRRTASELRGGLLAAADSLDMAAGRLDGSDTAEVSLADPAELPGSARHLWSAASAITAGCDLISTHFTVDRDGVGVPRSDWAQLLAAKPVAAGLDPDRFHRHHEKWHDGL